MDFHLDGIPPEHLARLLEAMPGLSIPSSPLVRVIPVAQTVEAHGVTVDLIAIEVRAAGAVVYWRARASRDVPMVMAEVSVSDDQGTAYHVMPAQSGGGEREWQGESLVVPPPPVDARLTIVLESFGPPGGLPPMAGYIAMEPVRGPWEFEVPASTG